MKIPCENTTKKWVKNCPKCGNEQSYSTKYTLKDATLKNKWCNKCRGRNLRTVIPIDGWKKLCPTCGKEQQYTCKSVLITSIRKNSRCNKCRGNEERKYQIHKLEKCCPKCESIMKYKSYLIYRRSVNQNWECKKCATKESAKYVDRSYQQTEEYRQMMSKILSNSERNKNKFTETYREKLRMAKLKQIAKFGSPHNYNPKACKFIEDFGKNRGYNFKHAMNGGEVIVCGYSLDGYDIEKNVVFEYDEKKHQAPSVRKNDRIREERIIKKINPNLFIRYDECFNKFYDVISRKEIF